MRQIEVLALENVSLLRRGLAVLDELDDDVYGGGEPPVQDGVGPQFRHLIEFYRCLLEGIESGRVDYTQRPRESRLELDRAAAAEAMRSLVDGLRALARSKDGDDGDVRVRPERSPADLARSLWSRSSLSRELQFLHSHTIHHYALIRRELLARGIELEREFGVAPSTLEHWEKTTLAD